MHPSLDSRYDFGMSTEEKEVWMRAFCAYMAGRQVDVTDQFALWAESAGTFADAALEQFNTRFEKVETYRGPA